MCRPPAGHEPDDDRNGLAVRTQHPDTKAQPSIPQWMARSSALNTIRMVVAVAAIIVVADRRFRPNQGYGYLIAWLYVGCLFALWTIQDTSIWKYTRGRPWRVYQHIVAFCVVALWGVSCLLGVHTTTIGIAGFFLAFTAIVIELVAMFLLWRRDRRAVAAPPGHRGV